MEDESDSDPIDRFILDEIETVPHLEALLLLWDSRPRPWSIEELTARLYLAPDSVRAVVADLVSRRLIEAEPSSSLIRYRSRSDHDDRLIGAVQVTYRREMIRVSTMIHERGSPAIRAFARAFRIRKDPE